MLSYSLERRVKPRLQHMRDLGVDLTSKDMSIASLLRRTDSSFCRRHGVLQPQSKPILDAGVDESRLVLSTSTGLDQNSMNIPAAGTRLWSRA